MSAEGGATGEGFGDYFAAAITEGSACDPELGSACMAGWDAVSFNPYDGSLGSGCLRRLDGLNEHEMLLALDPTLNKPGILKNAVNKDDTDRYEV